jgi:hypothetical protein
MKRACRPVLFALLVLLSHSTSAQDLAIETEVVPAACPCDPPAVYHHLRLSPAITNAVLLQSTDMQAWLPVRTNYAGQWHGAATPPLWGSQPQFFRLSDWEFTGGQPPRFTHPSPIHFEGREYSLRKTHFVTTDGPAFGPGDIKQTLEWSTNRIDWNPDITAGGNSGRITPGTIQDHQCSRLWVRETAENEFGKTVAIAEVELSNNYRYVRIVPGPQLQP